MRNWPGLGDVLKRTVLRRGQVGTGIAAFFASYVL
jgi:hypothetical protein